VSITRLESVEDPLSDYLSDSTALALAFKKKKLVPYSRGASGASSDSTLDFFTGLKHSSETLGACRNAIKFWSTTSNFNIGRKRIFGVDLPEEDDEPEVSKEEALKFIDIVNTLLVDFNPIEIKEQAFGTLFDDGNCFVKIHVSKVLDEVKARITPLPTRTIKLIETTEGKKAAYHENFTASVINKESYEIFDIYPKFTVSQNQTVTTILHIKMDYSYLWYSRPYWSSGFRKAFLEYLFTDNLTKDAETAFIGKHILEYEEDDSENDDEEEDARELGYDNFADRLEQNFTVRGSSPSSLIATRRPRGSQPMSHIELKPNTAEQFYKVIGDLNRRAILEACSWSERLLGQSKSEGFNEEALIQELEAKDVGILLSFRNKIEQVINTSLKIVFEVKKIQVDLEFKLPSTVEVLKKRKTDDFRSQIDAYAVGVRAGTITPNIEDEAYFRELFKFSPTNEHTDRAWKEDDFYRSPITLKGSDASEIEVQKDLTKATNVNNSK
jgi:hypothetical protein